MVSGIPTASGYEERVRFEEMEVVERGASEEGLLVNIPEGHSLNGWDVNVCGVREIIIKRHVKSRPHAVSLSYYYAGRSSLLTILKEFLVRTKQEGQPDVVVGRRYGAFVQLDRDVSTVS